MTPAEACLNHYMGPAPVVGIGELVDRGRYWLLVYEACGHTLAIPDIAGRDPVAEVRRRHAACVECDYQQRCANHPRRHARYG